MENQNELMTAQDVVNFTGFSLSWVHKAVRNGLLTCYKPNQKTLFFKRSEIESYVFSNRKPARNEVAAKIAATSYFPKKKAGK